MEIVVCSNVVNILRLQACTSRLEYVAVLLGRGSAPELALIARGSRRSFESAELAWLAAVLSVNGLKVLAILHTHPLPGPPKPSLLDEALGLAWGAPVVVIHCGGVGGQVGVIEAGYSCGILRPRV